MKLTVINGKVTFDYSGISMSTRVDSSDFLKAVQASRFLRETECGWNYTETEQVVEMDFIPSEWRTEYGNAREHERLIKDCFNKAKTYSLIEIAPDVEEHLVQTARRCKEIYEAEVAKEEALKHKVEWERKCKFGCGSCKNLCYNIDLPVCMCTGKPLEEKNDPVYKGNTLMLFNLVPFPSKECPFSVAGGV